MTEYWIWSNTRGGWQDRNGTGYTRLLHDAGRFSEHIAQERVANGPNTTVPPTSWPDEVMVEVNNTFLSVEAQQLLAEYERTHDRKVFDDAYLNAETRAIVADPDFQDSWAQMLAGEGREISFEELEAKARNLNE